MQHDYWWREHAHHKGSKKERFTKPGLRPQARPEPGPAQFARLEPDVQRNILGPGRFEAYRAGVLKLEDVAGYSHSADWGRSLRARSLKEIVGEEAARKWQLSGSRQRATLQRESSGSNTPLKGENPLPFDLGSRSGDKDQDLRDLERENSLAAKEAVYAFDQDGKALLTIVGDARHITIEGEDLEVIRGSIVTHNHPKIGSFSRGRHSHFNAIRAG